MNKSQWQHFLLAGIVVFGVAGCVEDSGTAGNEASGENGTETTSADSENNDPNKILIDGSSTVYPISVAMAEGFQDVNPDAEVLVRSPSGTSGGFKKFMVGETDINDASRSIKDKEITTCKENNIEPIELSVAIDGISVVVNKENTWCDSLTFEQLKALWEPGSKIQTWKDLNSEWPDEKVVLYGPDGDSGTFEYFTEKVIEKKKECREDYEPATDDNVLVNGIKGNPYALGYFGYGYYMKAKQDLKGLKIAGKEGEAIAPTAATIESYEYPLARPVFIYVNKARLSDKGMADFLKYYLGDGQDLVEDAGCVRLSDDVLAKSVQALEAALGG